jgi:hypothetical protein
MIKLAFRFNSSHILNFPANLLLFTMLVFPMVLELLGLKIALFKMLLFMTLIGALHTGRLKLHANVVCGVLMFSVIGLLYSTLGSVNFLQGALKQAQLYVLWPLIYVFLMSGASRLQTLISLEKTLILGALAIAIYGLGYILTQAEVLPATVVFDLFSTEKQAVAFNEGYIESRFPGLASLSFLIPFLFASLVTATPDDKYVRSSRLLLWIALFSVLILVFLSGRKALLLVTMLSPLIITPLLFYLPKHTRLAMMKNVRSGIFIIIIVGLIILYYMNTTYSFSLEAMLDMILSGIDFENSQESSAYSRFLQFNALLQGWAEHPLFGAGHGASVSYIRSSTMPWSYELFYLALLYQTGLVGFCLYSLGIAWIYWIGTRIIREGSRISNMMLPLLAGMSGVFIATATNPYLVRFDGLWVVFLPIALTNYWLLQKNEKTNVL